MPSVARWRRVLGQRAMWAFRYRPGDSLAALGITASRADATNCARYRDRDGIWQVANANVLRDNHWQYDTLLGRAVRTLLREGASTNSAKGSCLADSSTTYWSNAAGFTIATATSNLAGQTAYKHTNAAGGGARTQDVGTFVNGQTDCFLWIIESDPANAATTSQLGVYDATAAAYVHLVTLTWASKSAATNTGTGTSGVIDFGTGQNGGSLLGVWMTATGTAAGTGAAGNTRRLVMIPTIQAGKASISHQLQFEAATSYPSSPIVTVAGAVTRAADLISVPWTRNPEAGTWYVDYYDYGLTNTVLWIGANDNVTAPYLRLYNTAAAAPWSMRALIQTAAGASQSTQAATVAAQNRVELRNAHIVSGGNITSRLGQSVNGAAETVAADGTARALDAAWAGSPTKLYIGMIGGANIGANLAIRSLCYIPGPETFMDRLRALVLN